MPNAVEVTPSALARVRFDKAKECLHDAKSLLANDSFKASANRSYYSIFHAMRAVLALDRLDCKTHAGLIYQFNSNYIKTELFPKEYSKIIHKAFVVRNESDYEDFYVLPKGDVTAQVENAKIFLKAVEEYLERTVPEIKNI